MNKSELVKELANQAGLNQTQAAKVVEALFDASQGLIVSQLRAGGKIVIPGFGSFYSRQREARQARNPATGKTIEVKAKNVPLFKAGKTLKDSCEK